MSEWSFSWPDAVGFTGVVMLIAAYGALQMGKLSAERPAYSALNAMAAVLIAISLVYDFNAASMTIEVFWFIISVVGLVRSLRRQKP